MAEQQQLVIFSNQDEFPAVGSSIGSGVISRVGDSLRRLLIRRGRKISALVYGAQQLQSVIRNVSRPAWEVDQSDDTETIIHVAASLGTVADHATSVADVVVAIYGPGAH